MQSDRHQDGVAPKSVTAVGGLAGGRRGAAGDRSLTVAKPKLIGDVEVEAAAFESGADA